MVRTLVFCPSGKVGEAVSTGVGDRLKGAPVGIGGWTGRKEEARRGRVEN